MFQTQGLFWLTALVTCSMVGRSLSEVTVSPVNRGIALDGMYNLFGNQQSSKPTSEQQEPLVKPFSYIFGSGKAPLRESGWPRINVKFNHPIQSPVDLITRHAVTMDLPVLDIVEPEQPDVNCTIYNSGHTVYVYIKEDPSLRPHLIGGPLKEKFIFEQMHFHWGTEDIWGSEHFVDGESYAVEIHMVHFNSKYETFETAATKPDGLAVLTIFAEGQKEDNPLLEPLHKLLPQLQQPKCFKELNSILAMQWAGSALTLNHEYYTYPGSLTTPPYSENVVFILLPKPITLSAGQLASFRDLHSDHQGRIMENKRQLQPLHKRPIIRSTSLQ